jgi:hypothetical protein
MFWLYSFIFDVREVRCVAGDLLISKIQDYAFHIKRLAFTRRRMGKNRRRLGEKEDPRMWPSGDTTREHGYDDDEVCLPSQLIESI